MIDKEMLMTTSNATTTLAWSAILATTAALGSYGLACVLPFAAIAALAAITLSTRQAVALIGAVWGVNQIVGFTMLGYGTGDHAVVWGLVIGGAALLSLAAAKRAAGRGPHLPSVQSIGVLACAIVAYQAVMFVGAYALDGFASSTPEIVGTVARNDALWFLGLGALRTLLGLGLPGWFGTPRTA